MPLTLTAVAAATLAEDVVLKGGAKIQAPIIKEANDATVLDLGFDVLRVPRNEILATYQDEAVEDTVAVDTNSLYATRVPERLTTAEAAKRYAPAVVLVKTAAGLGSGFFINDKGYLITNFHVIAGEKRISVDAEDGTKTEYRVWNPFRSKVAAGILGGLDNIYIKPGTKLLYLGAAAGTTVSHCSDVVGPEGIVYAVEFSHRPGRDLVNMAKKRTNVIPIIEDARHPQKYRMLVGMVDTIFADVAQPDQARIVALNAQHFLKPGGNFIISIKANCIDSTVPAEAVFAREVKKLQQEQFKPAEQLTLEPYERDHAIVCGSYRVSKKK